MDKGGRSKKKIGNVPIAIGILSRVLSLQRQAGREGRGDQDI